jgi:toxin ParE1/3/4
MPDSYYVRWTSPAAKDLREIFDHIARDSSEAAANVATKLFDSANSLDLMPNRGRLGRTAGTRELIVPGLPHIIVYRVAGDAVHVLRILHGARKRSRSGI